MGSLLVRHNVAELDRMPRSVRKQVEAVHYLAAEKTAKVNDAAYVTHVALTHAGLLTAEEGRWNQMAPLGEQRYRVLVDNFTGVAAATISEFGL